MRSTRFTAFRWLAFSTFGVLLGTGLVVSAPPALAIDQGQAVTTAPPWAAYVTTVGKFLFTQVQETSCTGTIVADDWVLTAAHCVVVHDKKGNPTSTPLPLSKFEVVLGRSDLAKTWQGGQWTVDQLAIYPNYPASGSSDVALLHLNGPLPAKARPLPIAPTGYTLADSQNVFAYGYGNTSETYTQQALANHQYDKYKGAASKVLRLTRPGSYVQQTSCTDALFWCIHRVGTSEILHGDSGGPWVTDTSNRFVVGVTSVISDPKKTSSTTVVWRYAGAAQLTNSAVHDWLSTTAGLTQSTANTIYRNPSTGASWLAEADGFDHPIPSGSTYLCLTGQGDPVVNMSTFDLDEIPQSTAPATCTGSPFSSGDLLVGIGSGLVAHYSATGSFITNLDTGTGSTYETGGCFAPTGEYYQTNFSDGSVTQFSASGTVENSRWATLSGTPESCVVAPDGTVYVGDASGVLDQFASDGTLTSVMYPQTEDRGIDWLSWGPDNCTLRYTSEGPTVFQYNACTASQDAPFATVADGGPCYENAPLADGGMLVACTSEVVRLDSSGNTVAAFPAPGTADVFALAAAPSASSFYVADINGSSSTVYQVDLTTGATLASFTPSSEVEIDGLTLVP